MKYHLSFEHLRNKNAIITGGNGHLGSKISEMFAEFKSKVIIIDKNISNKKISNKNITFLKCDLSKENDINKTVKIIKSQFEKIDILINNAAYNLKYLKSWETSEFWDSMMRINLKSIFLLSEKIYPLLKKRPGGCIINISSIYGFCGPQMDLYEGTKMQNEATYAASKAGIIQLTRYYAAKWAPLVRVNSVSPGGIFRNQNKIFVKKYTSRTPLKRMATEEDILGSIAFLSSDMARYVTGHNLIVDGGWSVW